MRCATTPDALMIDEIAPCRRDFDVRRRLTPFPIFALIAPRSRARSE